MCVHVCMFTNACRCLQNNWQNEEWIKKKQKNKKTSFLTIYTFAMFRKGRGLSAVQLVSYIYIFRELFFTLHEQTWQRCEKTNQKKKKQRCEFRMRVTDQLFPHKRNQQWETTEPNPSPPPPPAPTMHHIHCAPTLSSDKIQYTTSESLQQCMLSWSSHAQTTQI